MDDTQTIFSVVEVVDGEVTEELAFFELHEDAYAYLRSVSRRLPHLWFEIKEN